MSGANYHLRLKKALHDTFYVSRYNVAPCCYFTNISFASNLDLRDLTRVHFKNVTICTAVKRSVPDNIVLHVIAFQLQWVSGFITVLCTEWLMQQWDCIIVLRVSVPYDNVMDQINECADELITVTSVQI